MEVRRLGGIAHEVARLSSAVWALAACQAQTTAGAVASREVPTAAPSNPASDAPEDVRATFERLVADIRAYHLFSSAWPEERWLAELPALESEVMAARNRLELLVALSHVGNSLRDGHLAFTPRNGWSEAGIAVLPVSFFQAGSPLSPRFFVQQAEPGTQLMVGDELITYDGDRTDELLERFRLSIDQSSAGARAQRLTELLAWRWTRVNPGILGSTVEARVQRGESVVTASLAFHPNGPPPTSTNEKPECAAPWRSYGALYELDRASGRLCLYKSTESGFSSYPIVRHVGFLYGEREINYAQLRRDREMLRDFLLESPALAGVLLDVRDNEGGHHADLFLPWYLSEPFEASTEWVSLEADLNDRNRLYQALRSWPSVDEYLRRASAGHRWWVRPFRCDAAECPPQSGGPVTDVPMALLVGPRCKSSCDYFFDIWTQRRAGPTVGTPPAAMLTSIRYPLPVSLGREVLGDLTVALSGTRASEEDPWHEGLSPAVDHPVDPAWPASKYERTIIETAIAALKKPPQTRPSRR